jgi:signal peptidase I
LRINRDDFLSISQETLERKGLFRFQAHGESMRPFILHNDILVIKSVNGVRLHRGDIILHRQPSGQVIAHRIVLIKRNDVKVTTYVTKGDSLDYFDSPVGRKRIIGKVIALEREGNLKNLESTGNKAISRIWALISPTTSKSRPLLKAAWRLGRFVKSILTINNTIEVILRYLQGITVYRRILRHMSDGVVITETDERYANAIPERDNTGQKTSGNADALYVTKFQARRGKRIIGSVNLVRYPAQYFPFDGYFITDMMVKRLYRGMGIGENLTQRIQQRCLEESVTELSLLVLEHNYRAINLYLKMGFNYKTNTAVEKRLEQEYLVNGIRRKLMFVNLDTQPFGWPQYSGQYQTDKADNSTDYKG